MLYITKSKTLMGNRKAKRFTLILDEFISISRGCFAADDDIDWLTDWLIVTVTHLCSTDTSKVNVSQCLLLVLVARHYPGWRRFLTNMIHKRKFLMLLREYEYVFHWTKALDSQPPVHFLKERRFLSKSQSSIILICPSWHSNKK